MGTEESKEKKAPDMSHEQIVNIINASNAKTNEQIEKSAASTEVIAYIMLVVVIASALYIVYRLITSYERMKTQSRLDKAVSLSNVRSTVV